jgi:hypothetical protein
MVGEKNLGSGVLLKGDSENPKKDSVIGALLETVCPQKHDVKRRNSKLV